MLPYSGYAYTEGFLDIKQEAWINAHVHAYQYFGGITRLLVPDSLKNGVVKNTKDETVINKTYQEMAAYYLIPKEWVIDYLLSTHYAKYRQKLKVHV